MRGIDCGAFVLDVDDPSFDLACDVAKARFRIDDDLLLASAVHELKDSAAVPRVAC
jgi:hypothetical protein